MFHRPLSSRIGGALLTAIVALASATALAQDQKLPDAPTPQNNAPAPSVSVPSPANSGDQGESSSGANPEQPSNTRDKAQQQAPAQSNPQPPPPGSQEIKTVPPRSVPSSQSGPDEMFSLVKNVSFVSVPVTVKDTEGKLVEGLLAKDFSIYEDGALQKLTFFTSDPFPLSAALVVDQGMPDPVLKKVNQTFSALGGAFGPFDEVAVFTYGNTVNKRQDFGNSTRMELALQRIKDESGNNAGASVVGGPFGAGPQTNSKPMPGATQVTTPAPEYHVLNDAILFAAQDLSRRSPTSRKIIFIISDGQEYGSRASYAQVLKVLLTDGIAVYAIGVDTAAMPVYNKISKARIPGFGYSNILPRYVNATGGDVLNEFSKEAIESAYQRITMEARNQYTLGYNTAQRPSSNYRDIEVRVKRPGLEVFAKHGYYPLPPQRPQPSPTEAPQGSADTTQPPPGY
ncbi:MAG TPA: VWA domain-containing protein [Terriglobales bacterium]|jgi:VWFA-related protein|nr:VWA domain-containing protein [Terriglobales bacterium]